VVVDIPEVDREALHVADLTSTALENITPETGHDNFAAFRSTCRTVQIGNPAMAPIHIADGRLDLGRVFVKKSGRTHRVQVDVPIVLQGSFQAHRRNRPFLDIFKLRGDNTTHAIRLCGGMPLVTN
jgi:hypothetical protein